MKESSFKKSNTTVAISHETAVRLDLFCRKSNITKKDFVSLSLDFFDTVQLTPNESNKALSWKSKSEDLSILRDELRDIKSRSDRSNETIANIHGLVAGSIASDLRLRDMIESLSVEQSNSTRLLEEIKGHKRHWWQRKNK